MDERQAKIQEDLRGLIVGEVRCDDVAVQMYASDGSIYQIKPLGVVRPASTADVVAVVQYAEEHQISLHARGSGTGLSGEALGTGLVLDFSPAMRRIVWVDETRVRVQPGVVLEQLNTFLAERGRCFGPDPATSAVTTIGSVIAVNSAGSHSLKYGDASAYVESLEVVLADGTLLEVGREPLPGTPGEPPMGRRREVVAQLAELLRQNDALIEKQRPKSRFNGSGFNVFDVLEAQHLDLSRLLTGSEGTLAMVTAATLDTVPLPAERSVVLLFFDRLESAARAALEVVALGPSACDLLDRRCLSLARDTDPRYDLLIPPTAEAALLVEQEGQQPGEAAARIVQVIDRVRHQRQLAFDWVTADDPDEVALFWQLARKVIPTLYRLKGPTRPVPFIEDMAVPPETLPGFLATLQNILKRHQVTASLFGHAGHGQLHVRPFLDLSQQQDVRTMRALATEVYQAVFAVGGTISGEHGDGLSRTPFVPLQYGELYSVFREVKRIFDPHNIFNPGKVIGDDPFLLVRNLREAATGKGPATRLEADRITPEIVPLQLQWTPAEVSQTARNCNGCGACRAEGSGVRMCPIFRFSPREEASPRAKANLMRGLMTGTLPATHVATDEFKKVVDLCVNCKMCRLECPAGVNIPKLMLEARAGYVAINGLKTTDWLLSRLELISAIGSSFSPLANWMIANPRSRWLIEKFLGIAQGRKLPRFTARPFLRRAARRRLTRPTGRSGPKVLYFVDTYANYHDPQLAESLVAVLEHNGVAVYVPSHQKPSGMALITAGALDRARQIARHNVALLAEGVRQGYTILATEPSALICLTQEYPDLLEDTEAQLVAENAEDACSFLWQLHREQRLRLDLSPVPYLLKYHQPCHLRALNVGSPGENLMRLIPRLKLRSEDLGCSGMAGTFGLKRENYRMSLRAGWNLIKSFRDTELQGGVTECSACKIQMEQGTTKPTVHPLKLLALAYGLMPGVASLLQRKSEDLVVT